MTTPCFAVSLLFGLAAFGVAGASQAGSIAGTVTAGGVPLEQVQVTAFTAEGVPVAAGVTDVDGTYFIPGLPAGDYRLGTTASGAIVRDLVDEFRGNVACVYLCDPSRPEFAASPTLTLAADTAATGEDFALEPGGGLVGTVTSELAAPLGGIILVVYDAQGLVVAQESTFPDGSFDIPRRLPPGTYYVRTSNDDGWIDELHADISCLSGNCTPTEGTAIALTADADADIDFVLARGATLRGTVTEVGGGPLEGVLVNVSDSTGAFSIGAATNASGQWQTPALPFDTYYVSFDRGTSHVPEVFDDQPCGANCVTFSGTPITLTPVQPDGIANAALLPGASLSGTVTSEVDATPIESVTVLIYDLTTVTLAALAVTAADGSWTSAPGLPPGTYGVVLEGTGTFIPEQWQDQPCLEGCDLVAAEPIVLTQGEQRGGIDFALTPGGTLSGRVSRADDDASLAGVTVIVRSMDGQLGGGAVTDAGGEYTVEGLLPGEYQVYTEEAGKSAPAAAGLIDLLHPDLPCPNARCLGDGTGTVFSIGLGAEILDVDFALPAGGRLGGTVTAADTQAGIPATLTVFDSNDIRVADTATAADGSWLTDVGLPAGDYYVLAEDAGQYVAEAYADVVCSFGCDSTALTAVSVTPGAVTGGIDFELALGARVSGTVTRAAGGSPARVSVRLIDADGTPFASGTSSSFTGNYLTPAVPPGTYYARTRNILGLVDATWPAGCPACIPPEGTPLVLAAGTVTPDIDFALAAGAQLGGVVQSAVSGLPIPGIVVRVFDAEGRLVTSTTSNDGGWQTSNAVPPGTYYLRTVADRGIPAELYGGAPCEADCVVTDATPVVVPNTTDVGGLDFVLDDAFIHGDGFETPPD